MKIENQVCTVDQSKKLIDLGICKDAVNTWIWHTVLERFYVSDTTCFEMDIINATEEHYPAFTVAELSLMLDDLEGIVGFDRESKKWFGEYNDPLFPTEAQAKAALLMKFLESEDNYINPEKCNKILSA